MKYPFRAFLVVFLTATMLGCQVMETVVRALSTGAAGGVGALFGFFLGGGPLGAALGATLTAGIAYLFAENGALKDAVAHLTKEAHRAETAITFWDRAKEFGTHAAVLAALLGAGTVYAKHRATRTKVNALVSSAWSRLRSK